MKDENVNPLFMDIITKHQLTPDKTIKIEVEKIDLEIDKLNEVIGRLRNLKHELLGAVTIEKCCNYCIDQGNLTGSQKCCKCIDFSQFRFGIVP